MNRSTAILVSLIVLGVGPACRIRSSSTPLDVDQRAPDFTLPNHTGQQVSLSSLTEAGPAVLVFNRGHR